MKKVTVALLAMLISFTSSAMHVPFDEMPSEVIKIIIVYLLWPELMSMNQTCKKLNNIVKDDNHQYYKKVLVLENPTNTPLAFFGSEKKLFIIRDYESQDLSTVSMIDGHDLHKVNASFPFLIAKGTFAAHGSGFYFARGPWLGFFNFDDYEWDVSRSSSHDRKIFKIYCMGNHMITIAQPKEKEVEVEVLDVFSVGMFQRIWISYNSRKIKDIAGLKNDTFLFCENETLKFENYIVDPYLIPFGDGLPVTACVGSPNLMITCHQDSSCQIFFKTESYPDKSEKMKLTLPLSFLVHKLFLKENVLIIVGTAESNQPWLLMMYSIDKEMLVFKKHIARRSSQIHLASDNIFVICKNCDDKESEKVEILAIDINKSLQK